MKIDSLSLDLVLPSKFLSCALPLTNKFLIDFCTSRTNFSSKWFAFSARLSSGLLSMLVYLKCNKNSV